MQVSEKKKTVLFVDDDEDDFLLLRDIFAEFRPEIDLQWVKDGEQALAALGRREGFKDMPTPAMILLDLNMPKMNGREVLRQIREDKHVCHIPVTVMTNSISKDEARDAYCLGVNSFIRKPSGFNELRDFVAVFSKYWFDYATLL